MMIKKRLITSQDKLTAPLRALFDEIYNNEFTSSIIWVKNTRSPFHAVLMDTQDITYLVKVKKPSWPSDEESDSIYLPLDVDEEPAPESSESE